MNFHFHSQIKTNGNLKRIVELHNAGCNASDISECFALGKMSVKAAHGDIPLVSNLEELGRKGLPKQIVRQFLSDRASAPFGNAQPC